MSDEQLRIRAVTAEEYWIPSMRAADAHIKGGGAAWMYRLDFSETSGYLRGYAFHSLDVRLVWTGLRCWRRMRWLRLNWRKRCTRRGWPSFAETTPAAPNIPAWPEYNSTTRPTMIFDTQNHVETKPQEAEMRLWDGVL